MWNELVKDLWHVDGEVIPLKMWIDQEFDWHCGGHGGLVI